MQNVVKEALAMLRGQGIRIPRSFVRGLKKKAAYVPNRADLRKFKEACSELEPGDKMVLNLTRKGRLTFYSIDSYLSLVKTAERARAGRMVVEKVSA